MQGSAIAMFSLFIFFILYGVWVLRNPKPFSIWAETRFDSTGVTNVKKHNQANALMWFLYSIPFAASGAAIVMGQPILALKVGMIGGTLGALILVFVYMKICQKYREQ